MARDDGFQGQTFRQLAWRLSRNSLIYTAGLIALRFGGLLLIPLYWRHLEPADYGVTAAASVVTNFLAVFLGLAVSESITRLYHVWPAAERREHVGTLWMIDWASSVAVGLPLALWGGGVVQLAARQVEFVPYLRLAVLAAMLHSLATTPTTLLRIREQSRTYVACSAAGFLLRTAATIYLVVVRERGALGVLEAEVFAAAAMTPVWTAIMLKSARPAWRTDTARAGLAYSLPLVPGVLAESLTWTADRFVLEKFVPLRTLGLYSVADSLGGIVRIVSGGLKTAWIPFATRAAVERDDGPRVIARAATLYVLGISVVAVAVALLASDVIALVGVSSYFAAAPLVPFFVVSHALSSLTPLALSGLGIARRTGYASAAAIAQLAVTVTGLFLLVPARGVWGALAAVTAGAAVRLGVGLWYAQRFYHLPFEWPKLGLLAGCAVAVFAAGYVIPRGHPLVSLLVRAALVAAYAGTAAWVCGLRQWWRGRALAASIQPPDGAGTSAAAPPRHSVEP